MRIFINTIDSGERFILLAGDGGVLMKAEDLIDMGLKQVPEGSSIIEDGEAYVPLGSVPGLTYTVDEKEATLNLNAASAMFRKNTLDFAGTSTKATFLRANSAFLNYGLAYLLDENFAFDSLSAPFETVLSAGGYVLYSNFLYTRGEGEDGKFVRYLTNVTKDDVSGQRRYVLGDFSASTGSSLGGSATLGGLSVSRNFSLTPYFVKVSGLDLQGSLSTPSEVSVYLNGNLLRSETLPPGEFALQNVATSGSGDVSLVIKDAYGREEKAVVAYYLSPSVLKPGLSEYSYGIGFRREELGETGSGYGTPAALGVHRYGLTKSLTLGLRAEAEKAFVNVGPTASAVLWTGGEVDLNGALSSREGRTGYAGAISYGHQFKNINIRLSARALSREYSTLSLMPDDDDRLKFESSASVGLNLRELGSVTVSLQRSDFYQAAETQRLSAYYSKRLLKDISFFATASRTDSDGAVTEVFGGISYILGPDSSAGAGLSSQDGSARASAYYQKNPPPGTGFGFRASADYADSDSEANTGLSAMYNGRYGIYEAGYRRSGGEDAYDFSLSGSVVFVDRSFYLSRPINDGFALVRTGRLENVKIYSNNQPVEATDSRGEAIVPGLASYVDNKVSIEDTDIPVNYSIAEVSRDISTGYRSGAIVKFDVVRLQGIGGRLFFMEKGVKTPAEYAGIEIKAEGRVIEAIAGKGGEFYVENIPAGEHPMRIFLKDKECTAALKIPGTEDIMVEIGEVGCEIH